MPKSKKVTDAEPAEIEAVMNHLTATEVPIVQLAKEVAALGFNEEGKRSDIIEQRAFGLMQFAKVGLTIIAGIAGLISSASIHDTPFRESLILLLAVAGAYLSKLFFRGAKVIPVGLLFPLHKDYHVKPDNNDVIQTQSEGDYLQALKRHVAKLMVYTNHRAECNRDRAHQLKFCYVNTGGFLISFFLFFVLSLVHLFQSDFTLVLPLHRIIGGVIFVIALTADVLVEKFGLMQVEDI
jgi:hypothetical protein